MRHLIVAACAATLLAAPLAANAQEGGRSAAERNRNAVAEDIEKNWVRPSAEEREVTTSHTMQAHGKTLRYKATAGTLTVRTDAGQPTASVFYVAYTLDGQPLGSRPITYMFNGGPGSPTMWLHMGAFGPTRVPTDNPVYERPAPLRLEANDMTLLDKTDLVFIDMVGAGYSRPLGDAAGSTFWGVDADADTFARAILRYTTKNNRWASPKYILGESYGTLRAGALSYQLHDRGLQLNGVILLSSIMNYGVRQPGFPQNYVSLLPTYAATAWYHNAINRNGVTLEQHVQRAREFAEGPYTAALNKGHSISDQEKAAIAQQMSALIGLDPSFIQAADLRVELSPFRKELLRDRRQTVGRLDSRYIGLDASQVTGGPEEDPASSAVTGAYYGLFQDYIANTLNYRTDLEYRQSARGLPGFDWNWSHRPPVGGPQTTPNTAVDLATVMRRNPHMKVLALNGYYDAATPFFGTEYDLNQMMLEPHLRKNVEFTYYEGGHMMYTSREPLVQLYRDLAKYYDETSNGGVR
ncbi:S10 family peptidase [Brevundimonas pishanensis]|uniref:S10 family peptidase n=1 Tax=Brevundimonas pishanensis TaxID=2896315 RepID=UPI001FA7BFDF|nr:peptidase S10 [Brevundimonas pishanensis]